MWLSAEITTLEFKEGSVSRERVREVMKKSLNEVPQGVFLSNIYFRPCKKDFHKSTANRTNLLHLSLVVSKSGSLVLKAVEVLEQLLQVQLRQTHFYRHLLTLARQCNTLSGDTSRKK